MNVARWMIALMMIALLVAGCSEDEASNGDVDPDAGSVEDVGGEHDDIGSDDAGGDADPDTGGDADPDTGGDADPDTGDEGADAGENGTVDEDCTLELNLSDGLIVAQTWEESVDAQSQPLICWSVPQNAVLPDEEDGWEIRVEREENAGAPIDGLEWYVDGYSSTAVEIRYGDCEGEADQCSEATPLTAGTYFLHIIDPGDSHGLAASLVFDVE